MSTPAKARARVVPEVTLALRATTMQLSRLNQAVGGCLGLALTDLEILDLVAREGPLTPGRLASMTGVSPATMTGIIDRLEGEGWARRERDSGDRRKVNVRAVVDHGPELAQQYRGMQARLRTICAAYAGEDLALIAEFLRRVEQAGTEATQELQNR